MSPADVSSQPPVAGSPDSDAVRRSARGLALCAAAAACTFVAAYVLLIQTSWGQTADDAAYLGRVADVDRRANAWWLNRGTLVIAGSAVLAALIIGWRRSRLRTALMLTAGFVVAVLAAEALKHTLPRPDLVPLDAFVNEANTFPSGHTTIAVGSALVLLAMAPISARAWLTLPGLLFAAAVATTTISAGWHRPSDALGGIAISTAVVTAVYAWQVRRGGVVAHGRDVNRIIITGGVVAAGAVVAGILRSIRAPEAALEIGVSAAGFVAASVLVALAAAAAVMAVVWMSRRVEA